MLITIKSYKLNINSNKSINYAVLIDTNKMMSKLRNRYC